MILDELQGKETARLKGGKEGRGVDPVVGRVFGAYRPHCFPSVVVGGGWGWGLAATRTCAGALAGEAR
jgi:hypothetical protein